MPVPGDAAGWYPNPDAPGDRWWNGVSWSDAYRGAGSLAPSVPVLNPGSTISPTSGMASQMVGAHPDQASRTLRGCGVGMLFFLAIGGLLSFAGLTAAMNAFAIPPDWTITSARVVEQDIDDGSCYPVFGYEVEGELYLVRDNVSIGSSCDPVGTEGEVGFNPANPADARVPHELPVQVLNVARWVVGAITALIGTAALLLLLRQPR